MKRRIAIAGIGKIARDQHIPTIANGDRFVLAGAVSGHAADLDVPVAASLPELMQRAPDIEALAICTPPIGRAALIEEALSHGLHVLVEKPPAATLSEAERFAAMAAQYSRTLYLTWHSREAAAVEPLRRWIAEREIRSLRIDWMEDVRVWHPGQDWIWEPGIGVFDPGINALSILTRLLPSPPTVTAATLAVPANRTAPITADLNLASDAVAAPIEVRFSFDQRGPQIWSITIDSDSGQAVMSEGGAKLTIDGAAVPLEDVPEYTRLYDRFADLIDAGESDADLAPFRLVADSYLLGRRETVGAFEWDS